MGETIYKEWCPSCGRASFVNVGDVNDCSAKGPDGQKCPWCGRVWLWEGSEEAGIDLENADIALGVRALY